MLSVTREFDACFQLPYALLEVKGKTIWTRAKFELNKQERMIPLGIHEIRFVYFFFKKLSVRFSNRWKKGMKTATPHPSSSLSIVISLILFSLWNRIVSCGRLMTNSITLDSFEYAQQTAIMKFSELSYESIYLLVECSQLIRKFSLSLNYANSFTNSKKLWDYHAACARALSPKKVVPAFVRPTTAAINWFLASARH